MQRVVVLYSVYTLQQPSGGIKMFHLNTRDIRELEAHLKRFAERAYPFATKQTLNSTAFTAMRRARGNIKSDFINRNKFTERSVLVERVSGLNVNRQFAVVGSTAPYMSDQEFGATRSKKGKVGSPIATSFSAGLPEKATPRTKQPKKPNRLSAIKLTNRKRSGAGRRQRNLIAVKEAAKTNSKFVFLDLGRKKGIFRLVGGKRNPKPKMVYDLSETSISINPQPWLAPAVDYAARLMPGQYRSALLEQLRRHGLFS